MIKNLHIKNFFEKTMSSFSSLSFICLIVFSFIFYYVVNFTSYGVILFWDIGFIDSSSPFMESLVDLYFIVWYMLIIVLMGVIYILARIIYLFTWNINYLSSSILKNIYDFFIYIYIYMNSIFNDFSDKNIFVSFLNKLNIVYNKITVLNLLYGNKKQAFLNVQDVSEYKKLEVAWCALPSAALISIGSPTFGLIFALDPAIDPVVTLKVIGHQWYWSYDMM
jgi:hypothetical protein